MQVARVTVSRVSVPAAIGTALSGRQRRRTHRATASKGRQMGKYIVLAVALVAVAFFLLHDRGASAGKAAKCLEQAGASVDETRFLEEGLYGGQQLPPKLAERIRKAEKGNYDVRLESDTGLLMVVSKGTSVEEVQSTLARAGGSGLAQGSGRVILYWFGSPSQSSMSIAERCLD
jgi:hypothetical protein